MTGHKQLAADSLIGKDQEQGETRIRRRETEWDKSLDIKATRRAPGPCIRSWGGSRWSIGWSQDGGPTVDAWVDLYRGSWP